MAVIADELYSLLMPLDTERLVVPRSCVAEVVRYSNPQDNGPEAGWLRGTIKWNNEEIPIVSFEAMCGQEYVAPSGRTRVVVFNPLSGTSQCPNYGILAEGFPQMVKINREVVILDEGYVAAAEAPVICQINMLKEHALIPDLELIEERIAAALSSDDQA